MAALFGGAAAAGAAAGAGGAGGLEAAVAAANSEQFNIGFEKMAEAAQRACAGDVGQVDATYVDHITQALKGLKDGSESITAANPLDNMGDMLAGLNLSDVSVGCGASIDCINNNHAACSNPIQTRSWATTTRTRSCRSCRA